MGLYQLTAPTEEPVTLAAAREHLRVDHAADDMLLTGLIAAARQAVEARTGRAIISQKWRDTEDAWSNEISLGLSPLISVEAVTYLDTNGTRQTLSPSVYQVVTDTPQEGYICPAYGQTWPALREEPGSIRIDYTAGYGNASAVPQPLKVWMLLLIGTWYNQREANADQSKAAEIPRGFWDGLLDPYRIIGI